MAYTALPCLVSVLAGLWVGGADSWDAPVTWTGAELVGLLVALGVAVLSASIYVGVYGRDDR